ncbi:MAG: hypothetical protein ACM37W_09480 [Actinomycetota bacterium]
MPSCQLTGAKQRTATDWGKFLLERGILPTVQLQFPTGKPTLPIEIAF